MNVALITMPVEVEPCIDKDGNAWRRYEPGARRVVIDEPTPAVLAAIRDASEDPS